uniref:NBS-LRR disease resistance protein n=1 Tax=Dasypyrum villosum TaxID=40247 RepID=A0A8K1IAX5_9POAL|nr:NBS-LRR disease resistance protein [Dasypyrum villosum]
MTMDGCMGNQVSPADAEEIALLNRQGNSKAGSHGAGGGSFGGDDEVRHGQAGGLLAQEYTLIRGVNGDLQYINDELASMQSFLRDLTAVGAGQAQTHGHRMKDWMKQIRDITYDIEDCIDDSAPALHGLRSDMCCYYFANSVYEVLTWWPRRDVAAKISVLKMRAQQIGERRERYGVNNPEAGGGSEGAHAGNGAAAGFDAADNQEASLELVAMKDPVGVEDCMKELEEWVIKDKNTSGVLFVVGFGGVGKTTIATALYRKFGDQFDHRAMVNVSQSSDINAVLTNIKKQVMPQSSSQKQESAKGMLGRLNCWSRRHLKGSSRYLILVDDVWSTAMWNQIRKSLPAGKQGSRIIVTTRFQAVATTRGGGGADHTRKVSPLGVEESERLFKQAFSESKGSEVDKVPKEVWKMCGGLPLAIVIMAGHVACNPNKSATEWLKVCKSLFPESGKDHGKDGGRDLTQEEVGRIVSHCYNDMPADIKTCSLYLSIFPKGQKISRKRLTRRWIAEAFVAEKQGLSVEDVAETYFNHLIRRKIIRPVEHSSNGKVKKCAVHDMVLEHIVAKASEENFITVIGGNWLMQLPSSKVRRLSLQETDSKRANDTEKMNLSHVRSLTMFGSLNQLPSHSFKFGIVQVLDLEGCMGFKAHHTEEICKMLLLKYLSLRRTDTKQLPKAIGKLENLETLDIRETSVVELPKTVCQLERLVNILGGNKKERMALKLPQELNKKKKMKALRILSGIEIVGGLADLHHLTELRKLAIYKLSTISEDPSFKDLSSSIEYLGGYSLHTLIIDDESSKFINSLDDLSSPPKFLVALELSGKMVKLPSWIKQLTALTKLTLSATALRSDNLLLLRYLDALFSLTFSFRAEKQDSETLTILAENKLCSDGEITIPNAGFKNLKLLRFFAPLLPVLSFSENAMPELERLELRFSMLEGLYGVENLAVLKVVHLTLEDKEGEHMTKEVQSEVERAVKGRTDGKAPKIILNQ